MIKVTGMEMNCDWRLIKRMTLSGTGEVKAERWLCDSKLPGRLKSRNYCQGLIDKGNNHDETEESQSI